MDTRLLGQCRRSCRKGCSCAIQTPLPTSFLPFQPCLIPPCLLYTKMIRNYKQRDTFENAEGAHRPCQGKKSRLRSSVSPNRCNSIHGSAICSLTPAENLAQGSALYGTCQTHLGWSKYNNVAVGSSRRMGRDLTGRHCALGSGSQAGSGGHLHFCTSSKLELVTGAH